MEMLKYNMESVLVIICLIFGVITAQQPTVPPLFGLGNTINEMIKAEVSRQIQESQDLIRRQEFTRIQQDVKEVTQDLDNSTQGKGVYSLFKSLSFKYKEFL